MKPTFIRSHLRFIVGAILLGLSLVFSTFSALKVLSAPLAAPPAPVTVPNTVGFEGFLADADGNALQPDGAYSLTFRIWDVQAGGNQNNEKWSESQPTVQVTKGLYWVELGSVATLPTDIFNGDRWIGVTANITGTAVEISPRTKVTSVPFALNAANANTVNSLSVAESGLNQHVLASDANGNATVSGGLDLGSATGAAAGNIQMSGSIITSTMIGARVTNTIPITLTTSGQWHLLTFNSHSFDTDSIHSTGTNPSRLTAKHAGVYLINVSLSFVGNSTGVRVAYIQLNANGVCSAGTTIGSAAGPPSVSPYGTVLNVSTVYALSINDYIEICSYQTSGGSLSIQAVGSASPVFSMVRLP